MSHGLSFLKQTLLYSGLSRRALGSWVNWKHRCLVREIHGRRTVPLRPVPPPTCGGHIEHYYHFLFDLLMPLHRLIRDSDGRTEFLLEPFGIFTDRLHELFPGKITITDPKSPRDSGMPARLVGMNPKHVFVHHRTLIEFRSFLLGLLAIDDGEPRDTILLVERMPPDPYFLYQAENKGSGTARRSILNHQEVQDTLQGLVQSPFRLRNIRLETMTFREQVECFAKAAAVIGQHGAGLSNAIWMRPGSSVIEFGSPEKRHFEFISRSMRHGYLRIPTEDDHATIDCARLGSELRRKPGLLRWIKG